MIPDFFIGVNVIDTCAIWNLVSSDTLMGRSLSCGHSYVTTSTVLYECLVKPRTAPLSDARVTLRSRLEAHLSSGRFAKVDISIEDLQEVSKHSGRMGQGELSCAAAARKINQAVMTDNKRDFRGVEALVDGRLQTTPRLLGWLVLQDRIGDAEVQVVVAEHVQLEGSLAKWYLAAYREALEKRLEKYKQP